MKAGGWHSTEVGIVLLTQQPWAGILVKTADIFSSQCCLVSERYWKIESIKCLLKQGISQMQWAAKANKLITTTKNVLYESYSFVQGVSLLVYSWLFFAPFMRSPIETIIMLWLENIRSPIRLTFSAFLSQIYRGFFSSRKGNQWWGVN